MEQKNNEQNSVIFSIAEILGKMSNQVSFLIRNNKLMSQLDVDMLMENTRKLYDTVCSVRCNMDVDSIPMEVEDSVGTETRTETESEERIDMVWDFTDDNDVEEDDNIEEDDDIAEDDDIEEDSDGNEFGDDDDFDEVDFDEDRDEDDEDEEDEDDADSESDSGIRAYRIVREEPTTNNQQATLGDVFGNAEDTSLAARLQKKPITDLTTAIGINDKFLLLNELFGGSMEKYNRSIKALNNFTTHLGAVTYMSELQIEFQWDCESEAYKKLSDLVERRFISIHNS
ncbi:MAG: hypothetical protein IKJ64_02985 [Bacteroidales bacterium]|nr:hypothetical protein [Bacteroidales bacterium]